MAEKKKRKDPRGGAPGTGNPALTGKAIKAEPGETAELIRTAMAIGKLPKVDLSSPEAVAERTEAYFSMMAERDMKPTVIGYAMALGIDRRQLWGIVNEQPYNGTTMVSIAPRARDVIKNGYRTMEFLWESYMSNRKIDTVAGIFLGKNHYGYKDQQETVVVTPNLLGDGQSAEQLEQKYLDSVVPEE